MHFTKYIGTHISKLLDDELLKNWPVEKYIENYLDEKIYVYIFKEHGLEVSCNCEHYVNVIFLYAEEYGGFDDSLIELSFTFKREQILNLFGIPSKHGDSVNHPILGDSGSWDRFTRKKETIHIEYKTNVDEINKITLMQNDMALLQR